MPYINNRLKNDAIPVDDPSGQFVGDTYYIVIVALDATCQTQIWGDVPTIDTDYAGSAEPTDDLQVLKAFRFPALIPHKPAPWQTVARTPYGEPFAFTPTSVGTEYLTLQWPADVVAKTVSTDHQDGNQPAEYESYLYGGDDWPTMLQQDYEGSRPGAASGWAPPRWDAGEGGITGPWWGYYEPLTVNDPATTPDPGWTSVVAGMSQHWVTRLDLVAKSGNGPTSSLPPDPSDPTVAKPTSFTDFAGPMKAGLSTIGYEATVALPQNLTIKTAAVSIKKGASVTISGQLAYDSTGAGVVFQAGQQVKIEKKVGLSWVTVKTVMSAANGAFSAKIDPTATTTWRARCTPSPAPVSGLTIETSLTKKISVHL